MHFSLEAVIWKNDLNLILGSLQYLRRVQYIKKKLFDVLYVKNERKVWTEHKEW